MQRKLGYFGNTFTRTAKFNETGELPEVNFSYRPLDVYETSVLVSKILDTPTVEESMVESLRVAASHITDWDLMKLNPKYTGVTAEGMVPEPELLKVDFTNVEELKKVSPVIMEFIINSIRGDSESPFMDKKNLEKQIKNS
jgi:hypothetical protein